MAGFDPIIQKCLSEIGMPSLAVRFKNERVDAPLVESLTDNDLIRLGIETIGHRHRFRQSIKIETQLQSETESRDVHNTSDDLGLSTRSNTLAQEISLERSRLFAGTSSSRKRNNRSKSTGQDTSKRSRSGFTLQFFCLAYKNQKVVPTSTEKEVLNNAGLGKKRIRLQKHYSQKEVFEQLMSSEVTETGECIGFPQLTDAGGFELLRSTQNCKELKLIDCSWSAKDLQKNTNPQATIYIRPLQSNLSTKPIESAAEPDIQCHYKTLCNRCKLEFSVQDLGNHLKVCEVIDQDISSGNETVIYIVNAEGINENSGDNIDIQQFVQDSNENSSEKLETELTVDSVTDHQNGTNLSPEISSSAPVFSSNIGVNETVSSVIDYCVSHNISNPVEILRKLQLEIVTGRALEIENVSEFEEGETNFILVDRSNILNTAFDEIGAITDLRKTLEVQFYNETAQDFGGPRKEFFRLALLEIKEKYFDEGLRDLLFADYEMVGKVFALSILQNGKLPKFLDPDLISELFGDTTASLCIQKLQIGLDSLGLYTVGKKLPSFVYIFQNNTVSMTYRMLTSLLHPQFSEDGSNNNTWEKAVYAAFLRYMREVASGRRDNLTLEKILYFVTGTDEEPILGFKLHPAISFHEVDSSFLPTANTCINCLRLPRPTNLVNLPQDSVLFNVYDYAFCNTYYGLQ